MPFSSDSKFKNSWKSLKPLSLRSDKPSYKKLRKEAEEIVRILISIMVSKVSIRILGLPNSRLIMHQSKILVKKICSKCLKIINNSTKTPFSNMPVLSLNRAEAWIAREFKKFRCRGICKILPQIILSIQTRLKQITIMEIFCLQI